jgi:hypothetical protein
MADECYAPEIEVIPPDGASRFALNTEVRKLVIDQIASRFTRTWFNIPGFKIDLVLQCHQT